MIANTPVTSKEQRRPNGTTEVSTPIATTAPAHFTGSSRPHRSAAASHSPTRVKPKSPRASARSALCSGTGGASSTGGVAARRSAAFTGEAFFPGVRIFFVAIGSGTSAAAPVGQAALFRKIRGWQARECCYSRRSANDGGRSSMVELQIVVLAVAGSSPVGHPI